MTVVPWWMSLVEGVLAVGAGLAPDDWAGIALNRRAVDRHALAVRFHVELLQIGREAQEPLIIGQDGARRITENVAVIEADQAKQHRQVLAHRRGAEMGVHRMRAIQELAEIFRTDGDHQRQADRRPDRITPADPIPEPEYPLAFDTEGGNFVERRRDRAEVMADGRVPELVGDEGTRRGGIGHRFDGREGLGGDDEQRRFRIEQLQRVGDMRAIDVGDEMRARAVMKRRQRQGNHDRAEVRSTDADIDDVSDLFAGRAFQRAGADAVGELAHCGEHTVDIRHDILAIDYDRCVGAIAQCRMQHGAAFGEIDRNAREHLLAFGRDAAGLRQFFEQHHDLVVHGRLGIVHQQVVKRGAELREPAGIGSKRGADVSGTGFCDGGLQVLNDGLHG